VLLVKAIAIYPATDKVVLIDHPVPEIASPTQVKVKILEVGICGTDKEICEHKYGEAPEGYDYLILGHEALGEVVEIGPEVTRFKSGDLVSIMVRRPCPHKGCVACNAGQQDFCETGDFKERGINGLHGFMAEYVVDEERYMVHIPSSLRKVGVLTEPMSISEKAIHEIFLIQKRLSWHSRFKRHVLVIGAGAIGLSAAVAFMANEFAVTVYSLEKPDTLRGRLAEALGARYLCAETTSPEELNNRLESSIDVILDASGASNLAFQLFSLLGYNGIFVWTGIPGLKEPVDLNAGTLMKELVLKNQSVLGTVNASYRDFEHAVDHLEEFSKKTAHLDLPFITYYTPEEFEKIMGDYDASPNPNIFKRVIRF